MYGKITAFLDFVINYLLLGQNLLVLAYQDNLIRISLFFSRFSSLC